MSIALISVSRIEQVVNAAVFNDRVLPKNSNSIACGITDFAIADGDIVGRYLDPIASLPLAPTRKIPRFQ